MKKATKLARARADEAAWALLKTAKAAEAQAEAASTEEATFLRQKLEWEEEREVSLQIRQLRQGLNQTQAEFARIMGVTIRTISSWEHGLTTPTPVSLQKLHQIEEDIKKERGW